MIAAIVQARMASSRLPGKVLKEVLGRQLLSFLLERLRNVNKIDKIIIATTVNKEDDPIVELCNRESVFYFRGSENDVLDRYYQAAKKFDVNDIMRITADCPLIDPRICENIIKIYFESDIDYIHTGQTFAEGLDCEVLSFNVLERSRQEASLLSEREHVTQYVHNHPELFKKVTFHNKTDDSKYRFTVDEQEDFLVVKAIFEGLYDTHPSLFSTAEIKNFLNANPDIFQINANIIRNQGLMKSLQEDDSD